MQRIRGAWRKTTTSFVMVAATAFYAVLSAGVATAQPTAAPAERGNFPAPVEELMTTADGVQLVTQFYPSTFGKETVPVILVHGFGGSGLDMRDLAADLQAANCAVLVPDMRGHGRSTRTTTNMEFKAEVMTPALVEGMVRGDMNALKRFLMGKHNAGELNINKLCIVGVELGAGVAANYAVLDWSWPILATGKQGQDVMGLVLISPEWTYKSLRMNDFLAHPMTRTRIPVCIIVGGEDQAMKGEATRLFKALERFHSANAQDLYFGPYATRLQGAKLLNEPSQKVNDLIVQFVKDQVATAPIPWVKREGPFK